MLILDDWGLEPFASDQRRDLLEIVERYGCGARLNDRDPKVLGEIERDHGRMITNRYE